MERFKARPANTDLYARIRLMPITEIERQVALNALRDAEILVDACFWIVNGIKSLFSGAVLKPKCVRNPA